jgi:hypothetical protein
MGRHRPTYGGTSMLAVLMTVGVVGIVAVLVIGATVYARRNADGSTPGAVNGARCSAAVTVVTASSFAPVLQEMAPALAAGEDCVRVDVQVVDGRAAAARVAQIDADVWIPDDASWAGTAGRTKLAAKDIIGSGATLATSPIFMITDKETAAKIEGAGGSWLGLANLLDANSGVRLTVREPEGSGDGLVAAGAVGEGVWIAKGMDASSLALADALPRTRTVTGASPALPGAPGEVGLVPEYALLHAMPADAVFLPGTDRAAVLRYTWLPTAGAVADANRAPALRRLYDALRGPRAAEALVSAGLRGADVRPLPGAAVNRLPELVAKPFDVLAPHHVDHVLATWYRNDRRSSLLMVIDVSGSVADPAPGTTTAVIELVKQGCRSVGDLLPDDARLGLWEFGSELVPPNDYRVLVAPAALDAAHRTQWTGAVNALAPRQTGTGLYDTILAAYVAGRDTYQPDMPNHVFVFTDGRNEQDPDSITLAAMSSQLAAANDPKRPVQLSVVAFGNKEDVEALKAALKPVAGYVSVPTTADEVAATFIHVAAGGLHG